MSPTIAEKQVVRCGAGLVANSYSSCDTSRLTSLRCLVREEEGIYYAYNCDMLLQWLDVRIMKEVRMSSELFE